MLNATVELMLRNGFFVKLLAEGGRLRTVSDKEEWLKRVVTTHARPHTGTHTHAYPNGLSSAFARLAVAVATALVRPASQHTHARMHSRQRRTGREL